jgi:hypothetical protein
MVPNYDRGDLIILQGGKINAPEVNITQDEKISFEKGNCERIFFNGTTKEQPLCTIGVKIRNETIFENHSNDLIVYEAKEKEFGLIIHRVLAKMNLNGKYYYITKGDNNYLADREFGISIASEDDVKGKVLLRIPFIGYIKLFLFFQFEEPPYCSSYLEIKK